MKYTNWILSQINKEHLSLKYMDTIFKVNFKYTTLLVLVVHLYWLLLSKSFIAENWLVAVKSRKSSKIFQAQASDNWSM